MLDTKLFAAFMIFVLIITLVAENEVDAAPEPCGDLLGWLSNKPEKLRKRKEDKEDVDDTEKPKKAMKKLQKLEKMFEALIAMK